MRVAKKRKKEDIEFLNGMDHVIWILLLILVTLLYIFSENYSGEWTLTWIFMSVIGYLIWSKI